MTDLQRAYHEAGHVIVLLELCGRFESVDIDLVGKEGGHLIGSGGLDDEGIVMCAAAGFLAEIRHVQGGFELTNQAWGIMLLKMAEFHGADARDILARRRNLDSYALAMRALEVLERRWADVESVAVALTGARRLSAADVGTLIDSATR